MRDLRRRGILDVSGKVVWEGDLAAMRRGRHLIRDAARCRQIQSMFLSDFTDLETTQRCHLLAAEIYRRLLETAVTIGSPTETDSTGILFLSPLSVCRQVASPFWSPEYRYTRRATPGDNDRILNRRSSSTWPHPC